MRGFYLSVLSVVLLSSCAARYYTNKIKKEYASESINFDLDQTKMILNGQSSEAMKLWLVTDKKELNLLRQQAEDISFSNEDKVLNHFIPRLLATMTDSTNAGVGIAAPQVGISKNIIWVQRFDKLDYPFEVYINPKITRYSEQKQPCREGCLSIPNRSDTLKVRSQSIDIDYLNSKGLPMKETVEGFTAVIFQHEIDHLNGKLYTDYLD